jgi:hypothetical protein
MTDEITYDKRITTPGRVPSTGRTGITLGILVAALLALGFYFYWRAAEGGSAAQASQPAEPR